MESAEEKEIGRYADSAEERITRKERNDKMITGSNRTLHTPLL
jgi:hypothetical protein